MELKLVFAAILFILPILARSQNTVVYDISDPKYGAKQNADSAKVIICIYITCVYMHELLVP